MNERFRNALESALGTERVCFAAADCWAYGYDNSKRHFPPQAVVHAESAEQIQAVVQLCGEYAVPLTTRGRGTATTGAAVPVRGGVVLSLERMQTIVEFDPDNRFLVAEPGVTNQGVQDAAGAGGFFWPPDPTSAAFCTVGGNLACNSAGPRAVKYGTPRDNTLGLRAVAGTGEMLRTGVYTTKGVVGYDLTRLLIGSEGTLAVFTQATLKLTPLPECKRTLAAAYDGVAAATQAIARIMAQPATPCALEFMDGAALDLVRQHAGSDLPTAARALLLIEVDGNAAGIGSAVEQVSAAARSEGLLELRRATTAAEVAALWQTRKALSPSLRKAAPNKINEDVVVPVTALPRLIDGLGSLSTSYDIPIVNFGHAGNGNVHVNLLYDASAAGTTERARRLLDEVFALVLGLRGTLSGEHGVGLEKRDYLSRELDPTALRLMAGIKGIFDPHGILNPDKVLPLSA